MASEDRVRSYRMYVDGKWVDAEGGASYALPNPATEETIATAPDASRRDMKRAIEAARRAFDSGPWRKTTPADRARILVALADGVEARKEEFRKLLVSAHACESITHGVNLDIAIEQLRNYAELTHVFPFEQHLASIATANPQGGEMLVGSMVCHQPRGVCGLIPTWNFPLYVTVQKIGPALATGCTMVVKPSPYGPLVDLLLAEVVEQCDLPPGVVNVVSGESPELGAELCEHPGIDMVSFTGSVSTGKRVMEAASRTLKRVHLELGGKSAAIILDDAELDLITAAGAAAPAYFHAGQGCAITSRVLIQKKRHDALVEQMANFIETFVKVGDPADPGVMLGPVIRDERRESIERYIAAGKEEGAELVTGGGRPADLKKGYFLEPTVFANVRNEMQIAREEIFGPVVSVIPFEDEDDAIRIANDSSYGLFGGIHTRDTPRALRLAKRIRTGGVIVNNGVNLLHAPFGGFKESGIGREGGLWGMHEFAEVQAISWKV
jgi:acyl-CoA reductase-like NAD-dependent aldehyde dehydrogenase